MKVFSFEKLAVWQNGRLLVKEIYLVTQSFPIEEKYGIIQQIRRAAISVTCNLAEGSGRTSGRDQARFSEIAFGSLMEILNLLIASADLSYIAEETCNNLRPLIDKIGIQLSRLRETQLNKDQ